MYCELHNRHAQRPVYFWLSGLLSFCLKNITITSQNIKAMFLYILSKVNYLWFYNLKKELNRIKIDDHVLAASECAKQMDTEAKKAK